MKKNKNRLVLMAIALIMGVGSQLLKWETPQVEAASEGDVSVTLHKRVWDGEIPAAKQNTGNTMADFGGTPLAGAEFKVYNVTEDFYNNLEEQTSGTAEEKIKNVQLLLQEKVTNSTETAPYPTPGTEIATKVTEGVDGIATFDNLASKTTVSGNTYDSVYLFIETKAPAAVTTKAVPIILNLPIVQEDNKTVNTAIHLYPKNGMTSDMKKEMTASEGVNVVDEDGNTIHTAEQGDVFTYKLTIDVPTNVSEKNEDGSYKNTEMLITDTPTEGLEKLMETIDINGFVKGTDYTVTEKNGGFEIKMVVNDKLASLVGSSIEVTYKMKLTSEAQPGAEICNNAGLKVGDVDIDVAGPVIFTGGYRFNKLDDISNEALANAKFVVKNSDGNYLHVEADGKYTWGVREGAYELVSTGDRGEFEIARLVFGKYQLEEIEAPTGYILPDKSIDFVVDMTSYLEKNRMPITNTKKGLLPSTGGNGIAAFIAIGAVVMGAMVMFYMKNNKKANNVSQK